MGWGGQGSGSRACGGQRAGLESFQALLCKHTCVLWVHIIYPSRANSPLYPWVPAPACVHTLPPGWPPPGEPLSTPPFPHHPLPASRPIHVPRAPRPATLGQSLPTPWAGCQGDGTFPKKQGNLLPSWPSCLLGLGHR